MVLETSKILKLIHECKNTSNNITGVAEDCLEWLLKQHYPYDEMGQQHWYCKRAFSLDPGATIHDDHNYNPQEVQALKEVSLILVSLKSISSSERNIFDWSANLGGLLTHCIDCVTGWETAKKRFIQEYISKAYPTEFIEQYRRALRKKEANRVIDILNTINDNPSSIPPPLMYHILLSPDLFSHPDIQHFIIQDLVEKQQNSYKASLPESTISILNNSILPGLIAYSVHQNSALRCFAHSILDKFNSSSSNSPYNATGSSGYSWVWKTLENVTCYLVASTKQAAIRDFQVVSDSKQFWQGFTYIVKAIPTEFLTDPLLKATPSSSSSSISQHSQHDIRKLICSHLGDEGQHLVHVIVCWRVLLERLSSTVWKAQGKEITKNGSDSTTDADYAQLAFDSLLDNPSLETWATHDTQFNHENDPQESDYFTWIIPFLKSISEDKRLFVTLCSSISHFLLVRCQSGHVEQKSKDLYVQIAIYVFGNIFVDQTRDPITGKSTSSNPFTDNDGTEHLSETQNCWPYAHEASLKVLDMIATILVQRAYDIKASSSSSKSKTSSLPIHHHHKDQGQSLFDIQDPSVDIIRIKTQQLVSRFLEQIMLQDSARLSQAVYQLAYRKNHAKNNKDKGKDKGKEKEKEKEKEKGKAKSETKEVEDEPIYVQFASNIWNQVYEAAKSHSKTGGKIDNSYANTFLGQACLVQALVPTFHLVPLSSRSWSFDSHDKSMRTSYASINHAFKTTQTPISGTLMDLCDEDSIALHHHFMKRPQVVEAIVAALFSPVDDISKAALSLIRQIYDVVSRQECFEQLLNNFPAQTIRGIIDVLERFNPATSQLPEVCNGAKQLVRCMTDVVNILCDPFKGLFAQPEWMEKAQMKGQILPFWKLMSKSIACIFDKTPQWAPFYDTEQMVEWMRDAIIFAHLLPQNVAQFEKAILFLESKPESPTSLTIRTPSKLTNSGKAMVSNLNLPLEKLLAWLRLTDADMLRQTGQLGVALIECFNKANVPIDNGITHKIRDYVIRKRKAFDFNQSIALASAIAEHPLYAEAFQNIMQDAKIIEAEDDDDDDDDDVVVLDDSKRGPVEQVKKEQPGSTSTTKSMSSLSSKDKPTTQTTLSGLGSWGHALQIKESEKVSSDPIRKKPSIMMPKAPKIQSYHAPPTMQSTAFAKAQYMLHPSKPQQKPASSGVNFGRAPMKNGSAPSKPQKRLHYSHTAQKAKQDRLSSDDESSENESDPGSLKTGIAGLQQLQSRFKEKQKQKQPKVEATTGTKFYEHADMPIRANTRENNLAKALISKQQKATDRAARLRAGPADYTSLYRVILQWNIKEQGPVPPNASYPKPSGNYFESPMQYIEHFKSLIILECWAGLMQSLEDKDSQAEPLPCTVAQRVSVDDFVEVNVSVDITVEKIDLTESSVVLFRQGNTRSMLAKVQSITTKRNQVDIVLRCHFGNNGNDLAMALTPRSRWEIVKLFSMTTLLRGWAALHSLPLCQLSKSILKPKLPSPAKIDSQLIEEFQKSYQVNKPQASAIIGSIDTEGFSLIQGPPGTGKTKTIIGLVSAVLSRNRYNSKVLLCAPSNAAVDEVARRLKDTMIPDGSGKMTSPKVVRIGVPDSINVSVHDIVLDELIERELNGDDSKSNNESTQLMQQIAATRSKIDAAKAKRVEKQNERADAEEATNKNELCVKLDIEIQALKQETNQLSTQLQDLLDKRTQSDRRADASKRIARDKIMSEAEVICSTLSGAGHEMMSQLPFDFETVIIDEAAQSVEVDCLIPIRYGCTRCIMVGDPNQLPPTVLSAAAKSGGYDQSLFVRLQRANPKSAYLLSIQYRMHPQISAFPSKQFYNSELKDGPDMEKKTSQVWHKNVLFPPYIFLDISKSNGGEEASRFGHSRINRVEATIVLNLYTRIRQEYPKVNFDYQIGVVTPYKGQVYELKRQFRQKFGEEVLSKIDFNTVDGFQGQEKSIIIFSCVRGSGLKESQEIGFLKDFRRMNVGLTRAISSLFIIGNSVALGNDDQWRPLIEDAKERSLFKEINQGYFISTSRPSLSLSSSTSIPSGPKASASSSSAKKKQHQHVPETPPKVEAIPKRFQKSEKTAASPSSTSSKKHDRTEESSDKSRKRQNTSSELQNDKKAERQESHRPKSWREIAKDKEEEPKQFGKLAQKAAALSGTPIERPTNGNAPPNVISKPMPPPPAKKAKPNLFINKDRNKPKK